ncbi:MAG: SDR family NAD(P)-dependent oxidoreductase [Alphaproteobacteria bacterium]|nr:SDR family NAD(P)-dependent oxidoreductase [Alphaproteobacteria bacterium]MDE2041857.1 SDR family NAD(P)-dependent oxidoreductase [Alphaproteobacteria bacterium]MDE2341559.1 SDR family NAD(P)-dependent oxidoreductase [Alphaproteobacteria bacterium]
MSEETDIPTAIITGASAGVGKAAARQLLAQGWRVIGQGRDAERCAAAEAELAHPHFTLLRADLSLMADVARLVQDIAARTNRIDALINNAGGVRATQSVSSEGFEATFAANHLAPFLLTTRLLPILRASKARVIAVSSTGHEHCPGINWDDLNFHASWSSGVAYCQAKLCNILFARELARREGPHGIISHAMHPGVVASNFASHCEPGMKAYMQTLDGQPPDVPAQTLVWLATAAEPAQINGRYFYNLAEAKSSTLAQDNAAAAMLWEMSERLIAPYR